VKKSSQGLEKTRRQMGHKERNPVRQNKGSRTGLQEARQPGGNVGDGKLSCERKKRRAYGGEDFSDQAQLPKERTRMGQRRRGKGANVPERRVCKIVPKGRKERRGGEKQRMTFFHQRKEKTAKPARKNQEKGAGQVQASKTRIFPREKGKIENLRGDRKPSPQHKHTGRTIERRNKVYHKGS